MANFISDEEMDKLAAQGKAKEVSENFISDEEMEKLAVEGKAKEVDIPGEIKLPIEYLTFVAEQLKPLKVFSDEITNTLTLGYAPQIIGAKEAAKHIVPLTQDILTGAEGEKSLSDVYAEGRDKEAARLQAQAEENPLTATGGKIIGSVGSGFAFPQVGGTAAAKAVGNIASMAAQQFLQNPGDVAGEINPLQVSGRIESVKQAAKDPLTQAAAAIGFVGPAVGAVGKYLAPEEGTALAALGTKASDVRTGIRQGKTGDVTGKLRELTEFAKDEGLIKPFSPTWRIANKVSEKIKNVGSKIGKIREISEKYAPEKLKEILDSNPGKYGSFIPEFEKAAIFSKIDLDFADPTTAESIKKIVAQRLDSLAKKHGNVEVAIDGKIYSSPKKISVSELSKLKAEWQDELRLDKFSGDYGIKEKAFNYLKNSANNAINSEIELTDAVLKKSAEGRKLLPEHTRLKNEYKKLLVLKDGIERKLTREEGSGFAGRMFETPLQSAAANMPENLSGKTALSIQRAISPRFDQKIEGFPQSMTKPLDEIAFEQQIPLGMDPVAFIESIKAKEISKINKDTSLTNINKAKRRNLLEKHGLVYIGN